MTARNILYAGLVNYKNTQKAINRYTYHALEKDAIGYADDVVSFPVKSGQKPSEALDECIKNQRPQYSTQWRKSIFPTFVADKEPKFETFENRRPTPEGEFKPLES